MTESLLEEPTQPAQLSVEDISHLSEAERLARRREKFGVLSKEDESTKKLRRAQRFSISTAETEAIKMQQRRERFSAGTSLDEASGDVEWVPDAGEVESRKRRAERFGIVTSEEEARRKQVRAQRFNLPASQTSQESLPSSSVGSDSWAAKLAARQLRFGGPTKK